MCIIIIKLLLLLLLLLIIDCLNQLQYDEVQIRIWQCANSTVFTRFKICRMILMHFYRMQIVGIVVFVIKSNQIYK